MAAAYNATVARPLYPTKLSLEIELLTVAGYTADTPQNTPLQPYTITLSQGNSSGTGVIVAVTNMNQPLFL